MSKQSYGIFWGQEGAGFQRIGSADVNLFRANMDENELIELATQVVASDKSIVEICITFSDGRNFFLKREGDKQR